MSKRAGHWRATSARRPERSNCRTENANRRPGRPSGSLSLTVPRGTTYKSTSITAVVITGNRARVFGRANGPNRTTVDFVVEIEDGGKGAGQDRFRLDASDGFSTGQLALQTGSLTISQK